MCKCGSRQTRNGKASNHSTLTRSSGGGIHDGGRQALGDGAPVAAGAHEAVHHHGRLHLPRPAALHHHFLVSESGLGDALRAPPAVAQQRPPLRLGHGSPSLHRRNRPPRRGHFHWNSPRTRDFPSTRQELPLSRKGRPNTILTDQWSPTFRTLPSWADNQKPILGQKATGCREHPPLATLEKSHWNINLQPF
jgi:hypothetical protein